MVVWMGTALHGLWHSNTYSPADGWRKFRNFASPGLGFETRSLKPFPLSFLLLHVHGRDESPQLPASVTVPLTTAMFPSQGKLLTLWSCKPAHTSSVSCFGHGILSQQQGRPPMISPWHYLHWTVASFSSDLILSRPNLWTPRSQLTQNFCCLKNSLSLTLWLHVAAFAPRG